MSRRQKIVVAVVLGTPVLIYLALALLTELGYREFIAPKLVEMKTSVEKHLPAVLEDAKLLDQNPIFGIWTREKNAEPYLTKYVRWADGDLHVAPEWPEHPRLLAIEEKYKKTTIESPAAWITFRNDSEVQSLDVSWVDRIVDYDHWDFQSYPKIKAMLESGPTKNSIARVGMMASSPIPENFELRRALLVRFAQLETKGELAKGFELLRHGAKLFHTSSSLIGSMLAVDVLAKEQKLVEFTKFESWQPIDEPRRLAYKRLAWGWGGVLGLATWEPEALARFEPYLTPENGVCSGTMENVSMSSVWGEFLERHAPLERDYAAQTQRIRETTGRFLDRCGLAAYRGMTSPIPDEARRWLSKDASGVWSMVGGGVYGTPINPSEIPHVRKAAGLLLLTIAIPNWMKQYDERQPASK